MRCAANSPASRRNCRLQQAALKAKEESLQKDGATMTREQRTKVEKDLRDGNRELQQKVQEYQDDFNARQNEELSQAAEGAGGGSAEPTRRARSSIWCWPTASSSAGTALDITPQVLAGIQAHGGAAALRPAARLQERRAAKPPPPKSKYAGLAMMSVALGELAVRFGCELRGDPDVRVEARRLAGSAGPGT